MNEWINQCINKCPAQEGMEIKKHKIIATREDLVWLGEKIFKDYIPYFPKKKSINDRDHHILGKKNDIKLSSKIYFELNPII